MNIRPALKKWEHLGGSWEYRHSDLYLTHPNMPRPIIQSLCRKTASKHFQGWIRRLNKIGKQRANGIDLDSARFRSSVLHRDQFVCLRCGTNEGQLDAHHVTPRGRGGSHHPGNGATTCRRCHDWIHAHPHAAKDEGWLSSSDPFKEVKLPWADDTEPMF